MDSSQSVWFAGECIQTDVTCSGSTISLWISNVRSSNDKSVELIVGLDCECNPDNPPATLQLCVGTKCLIIQLLYLDCIPKSLMEFLEDSDVVLVGVGVKQKATKIREEYGFIFRNVVDVGDFVMKKYSFDKEPGLECLALKVLGLNTNKPGYVRRSNWEASELNAFQVKYACVDAYASYKIGSKLLEDIFMCLFGYLLGF